MACSICKRVSTNKQNINGKEFCYQCVETARKLGDVNLLIADPARILSSTFPAEHVNQQLNEQAAQVLLTTAQYIDGYIVSMHIDVISTVCVFGLNLLTDIKAAFSDSFGGRSKTLEKSLNEMISTCQEELRVKAAKLEANAVISVKIDTEEISGGGKSMLFVVASGTAVKIAKR